MPHNHIITILSKHIITCTPSFNKWGTYGAYHFGERNPTHCIICPLQIYPSSVHELYIDIFILDRTLEYESYIPIIIIITSDVFAGLLYRDIFW